MFTLSLYITPNTNSYVPLGDDWAFKVLSASEDALQYGR